MSNKTSKLNNKHKVNLGKINQDIEKQNFNFETETELTRTGDVVTNDFDLNAGKIPPLSTIRAQIKQARELINTASTVSTRIEFDRLRIGVNLASHGIDIEFLDIALEDVENPKEPPSFMNRTEQRPFRVQLSEDEPEEIEFDISDILEDDEEFESVVNTEPANEHKAIRQEEQDVLHDFTIKRRIGYEDWKSEIGLNNLFIYKGCFVIDMTGKWQAENGVLGSLHRDNIRNALQKVLELGVVNFNIEEFLRVAQVFICDVCVDLQVDSKQQVERFIEAISSFLPLASNRYKISKYHRHGLMLVPKVKKHGSSLTFYLKGEDLSSEFKRTTRATIYTNTIGRNGIAIAKRTLRLEAKLFRLDDIRKTLDIPLEEQRVVMLTDVLNSTVPVMLQQLQLFCGEPEKLLERLDWLHDLTTSENNNTLKEIFIAERVIELLKQNNFDLNILRSHIKTEYINVTENELTHFNQLANLRTNVLIFLVYRKPKTITLMLDLIARLQRYYGFVAGDSNG
ncbi:MAG: hypothetical protein LUB59_04350 [Candidatus Gastranaerophilales bacterium]|nr:hypothetical protein [Candidatus Gastranaerophilales bacterium]